jgi:vitamin B12 transporter
MRAFLYLIIFSCSLPLQQLAVADNPIQQDIDQIVVTGARTELSVSQIGSAATIITRAEIERREARYVSDLLRSVPGFSVSRSGVAGSQTQVRVRGAEANHILVLIDGVRANDPATGDEFRWEYLSTGNIERIEIIRGPQSSLWGSDAVSAVVHIITQVEKAGPSIDAYAESGSFGTRNAGLNGTLGGDRWTLRGGVESLATDGSNISRTGTEKDQSDLTTVNLSADFTATEALSLNFGLRAVNAYSQFDPVDFFVTGLPTDGDVATDTQNLYAHAGAVLQRDDSRLSQQFYVRYFDSDNRNLLDGLQDSSTASDRRTFTYQADIRLGDNVLALALEREETGFEQRGITTAFGDPNQVQGITVSSAIAEFQGRPQDRLTWIVSARIDDNSDFDNAVNGRLSLAFDLSDTSTLRGSVATGQKNPTFIERFGYFADQFFPNPGLRPETSTSYDIGIDQHLWGDRLLLQVSLFQQDLNNEINGFSFDPNLGPFGGFTAVNMDGTSKRRGVEVATRWALGDSFGLAAELTYTDATEPDRFSGHDVPELRRPKYSGGLSFDYRTLDEKFSTSLTADYGGTRQDIFFPPWPNPSEIVTLSNYWLVDIAAQYRATPTVTLFVKGSNLLDEDYEEVYGYRTLGRAAYIGVRVNIGR